MNKKNISKPNIHAGNIVNNIGKIKKETDARHYLESHGTGFDTWQYLSCKNEIREGYEKAVAVLVGYTPEKAYTSWTLAQKELGELGLHFINEGLKSRAINPVREGSKIDEELAAEKAVVLLIKKKASRELVDKAQDRLDAIRSAKG